MRCGERGTYASAARELFAAGDKEHRIKVLDQLRTKLRERLPELDVFSVGFTALNKGDIAPVARERNTGQFDVRYQTRDPSPDKTIEWCHINRVEVRVRLLELV